MTEVVAVLNRHRNAGHVTQSLFNMAYAHFEAETRMVRLIAVRNHQIDAHLQVALDVHSQLHRQGDTLLFFTADRRLLRAAQAEGLTFFNPETGSRAQLETLLA
jgi:hypothetical protein